MAKSANDYLKTSRIPYLVLDAAGIPVEWNAYAETLLSISGKNPAGKGTLPSIREIVLEQSNPGEIDRFDSFLTGNDDFFSCEFTRQKDEKTLSWYRLNVHRQEGDRFFALIDDITPQIIKETHLIEAKENAEKASLNRSQFLANISHELRTPIQTIIGMSELLAETPLDEEQTEYARQVRFSADVLLTLINDILDITKVEAGKLKIESIDFDPVDVIEGTVDLVAMEAHKKGVEVNIDISTDIPAAIVGDPNRLQQVLLNLVKNAVKFTEKGEIFVRAFPGTGNPERSINEQEDQILYVEVTDTGIGMEESVRERLFTDFYQADASTTRKYGGTGLGLSISRNIVTLMKGKIGVSPNEPQGSRFWFEIPLITAATQPTPRKIPLSSQTRFLLVDDNPSTLTILTGMLAAQGYYQVSRAESGERALSLMHSSVQARAPFDIVFIDLIMPDMDGWRLAAEITRDTKINQSQLYLMVPEAMLGAEAKMKLLDWFNGYLYKPVKRRLLYDLLQEHSQRSIDLEVVEELEVVQDDDESVTPIIVKKVEQPIPIADNVAEGLTVLVAEDHPVNRRLLVIFLEKAGARVVQTGDGEEAIEALPHQPVDLVFMDIQMPRKNGYETAIWMREHGYTMPIIACTASAQEDEREKCLACGMNEVLPKPYRRQDVLELVEQYKSKNEPAPSAAGIDDTSVFNPAVFFDILMGDTEAMTTLIREYIAQTEKHLELLEKMCVEADHEAIQATAHLIKGSSRSITANRVAKIAEEIEKCSDETGPNGTTSNTVTRLKTEFSILRQRLRKEGYSS